MHDIFLDWGSDLGVSSTGDLALTSDSEALNQRISRRLLTNQGDYIWNLDYGAGLARFIGNPVNLSDIQAIVMKQLSLETAIPTSPPPMVHTRFIDAARGRVAAEIKYTDPASQTAISFGLIIG